MYIHENDILLRIAKIRYEKVKLIGLNSFADDNALHFVDDLHDKVINQFKQETDRFTSYQIEIT